MAKSKHIPPMSPVERRALIERPFPMVRIIPPMTHAGTFVDDRPLHVTPDRYDEHWHDTREDDDLMDFLI